MDTPFGREGSEGSEGSEGVVAADAADFKKGRGSAAGCVEGLHPTGETTHYDLCVAGAPSNHVRCASLRSGGDSTFGPEGCGLPFGQYL